MNYPQKIILVLFGLTYILPDMDAQVSPADAPVYSVEWRMNDTSEAITLTGTTFDEELLSDYFNQPMFIDDSVLGDERTLPPAFIDHLRELFTVHMGKRGADSLHIVQVERYYFEDRADSMYYRNAPVYGITCALGLGNGMAYWFNCFLAANEHFLDIPAIPSCFKKRAYASMLSPSQAWRIARARTFFIDQTPQGINLHYDSRKQIFYYDVQCGNRYMHIHAFTGKVLKKYAVQPWQHYDW